jgi:hypothetical protein
VRSRASRARCACSCSLIGLRNDRLNQDLRKSLRTPTARKLWTRDRPTKSSQGFSAEVGSSGPVAADDDKRCGPHHGTRGEGALRRPVKCRSPQP